MSSPSVTPVSSSADSSAVYADDRSPCYECQCNCHCITFLHPAQKLQVKPSSADSATTPPSEVKYHVLRLRPSVQGDLYPLMCLFRNTATHTPGRLGREPDEMNVEYIQEMIDTNKQWKRYNIRDSFEQDQQAQKRLVDADEEAEQVEPLHGLMILVEVLQENVTLTPELTQKYPFYTKDLIQRTMNGPQSQTNHSACSCVDCPACPTTLSSPASRYDTSSAAFAPPALLGAIKVLRVGPHRCFFHILCDVTIAVAPAYQSLGVGGILVECFQTIISTCRAFTHIGRVELIARESHMAIRRWYELKGFRQQGRLQHKIHHFLAVHPQETIQQYVAQVQQNQEKAGLTVIEPVVLPNRIVQSEATPIDFHTSNHPLPPWDQHPAPLLLTNAVTVSTGSTSPSATQPTTAVADPVQLFEADVLHVWFNPSFQYAALQHKLRLVEQIRARNFEKRLKKEAALFKHFKGNQTHQYLPTQVYLPKSTTH